MDIETGMMVAFIIALGFSAWKMYAFMPNKPLEDDDRTDASEAELHSIMVATILKHHTQDNELTPQELYNHMKNHEDFNQEKFWRFNANRLNQILLKHAAHHPNQHNIAAIYKHHKV
jgi:hypothetical protein